MLQRMWRQHSDDVAAMDVDEARLLDSAIELFLAALR
jgi:hypothetical protein